MTGNICHFEDCATKCAQPLYFVLGIVLLDLFRGVKDKPKPTDADIDNAITNICRCGTFQQVREAIHAAAKA